VWFRVADLTDLMMKEWVELRQAALGGEEKSREDVCIGDSDACGYL
jgi:hypothetical protein